MTGVGAVTVPRRVDWREHHGLLLDAVYRDGGKHPATFDTGDLDRLADMERFQPSPR